jgi:uncharacterized protein YyaL (SSP411 family)
MLQAVDRSLAEPVDAVVVGPADDPLAAELRRAVAGPYAPDLVVAPLVDPATGDADARLAALPLFEGKAARQGRATAYVCRGYACDEPTSDPERAAAQVAGLVDRASVSRAGS